MSNSFFSKIEEPRIVGSIRAAELRSRGEIRIHITEVAVDDPVKEATAAFERLGMTATQERNGILIFIAPKSHKFAVLGDSGITSRVGTAPLDEMASTIQAAFREGHFSDGLVAAVEQAGDLLATHFPRVLGAHGKDAPDNDDLSNTISRG